ncbi:MAG: hypothetical protein LBJ70_02175 [Holosporales bacterium]|jgi:hypothetical protein|nr:hypothetical protein [Holosporales bacterium]
MDIRGFMKAMMASGMVMGAFLASGMEREGLEAGDRALGRTTEFLRLDPVDENHSYAVYRAVDHAGEQPFWLGDFVDKDHLLEHHREVLRTRDHDLDLRTEKLVRVFVHVGEEERLVREETVFTPYPFADREEDRWSMEPATRFIIRDYKRSDESILSRDIASFPHQSRITSSVEDDKMLETRLTVETFAVMDGREKIIWQDKRVMPYSFVEREDNRKAEKKFAIVRDYKRGNGTTLSKDHQVFPYQERCTCAVEEDASLSTKRVIEMFVAWGNPHKILGTEMRSVPYAFTEREDNRKAQKMVVVVRDYKRGNGSSFPRELQTFPYQERCIRTVENDTQHVTERTFQMFVARNPQVVRDTQVRPTPHFSEVEHFLGIPYYRRSDNTTYGLFEEETELIDFR